jgi:hypothetical protein
VSKSKGNRGHRCNSHVIVPSLGDPCPRCCQPTQIREHEAVLERHLRQPFYYRRWFYCLNPKCKVTTYMPERHKVWNIGGKKRKSLERWMAKHTAAPQQHNTPPTIPDDNDGGRPYSDAVMDTLNVMAAESKLKPPWED